MEYILGSARHDENGHITGGKKGDQTQKLNKDGNDFTGEVSMQKFYIHSKGWYVLRPKSDEVANKIAEQCKKYCNDKNIGYNQNERHTIMNYDGKTPCNCDCSSLVRREVKDATGYDLTKDFYTANARALLIRSGLFNDLKGYTSGMKLYTGDILVTKTKGHIVTVVVGEARVVKPVVVKPAVAKPVIKRYADNKLDEVKLLQKDLNYLGFTGKDGKKLEIDGSCGANTDYAIKAFQKKYGLEVDGSYGKKSAEKMQSLLK